MSTWTEFDLPRPALEGDSMRNIDMADQMGCDMFSLGLNQVKGRRGLIDGFCLNPPVIKPVCSVRLASKGSGRKI